MSYHKGEPRLTELLRKLDKVAKAKAIDSLHQEEEDVTTSAHRGRPEKAGIDLEPSRWPIGGHLPLLGKSSSRLYSWRSDRQVQDAIAKVALYLHGQRDQYYPIANPLSDEWKNAFAGFYSSALLNRVRIVQLEGRRVDNPGFYEDAKSQGIANLPDMAHRAVVTFLDVVVFNEAISSRHLFHGLVHTAQVKLLGAERYAELFVTGFLQARSYFLVPLKAHAFALDTRYAEDPSARFSVEAEVLRWAAEDRY